MISLIIDKGQLLASIKAKDDNGNPIQVIKSNFNNNDIILHFSNYPALGIQTNEQDLLNSISINVYPNPSSQISALTFNLIKPSNVKLEIINILGNNVMPGYECYLGEGWQTINVNTSSLTDGIYFCKMTVNSKTISKKLIVSH